MSCFHPNLGIYTKNRKTINFCKISWNKNVFLMTFNDDFYDGIFEKALRSEYSQLTTLKVDEKAFFKNSIFDVGNVSGRRKLLDAELLAVWQFGGTAITQDVLATCQLPQPDESYCLVSLDMISCPKQCSAFLYQVMNNGHLQKQSVVITRNISTF